MQLRVMLPTPVKLSIKVDKNILRYFHNHIDWCCLHDCPSLFMNPSNTSLIFCSSTERGAYESYVSVFLCVCCDDVTRACSRGIPVWGRNGRAGNPVHCPLLPVLLQVSQHLKTSLHPPTLAHLYNKTTIVFMSTGISLSEYTCTFPLVSP